MKIYKLLFIVAIIFVLYSCNKETTKYNNDKNEILQDIFFNAVIVSTKDASCFLPLIKFIGDTTDIYLVFIDPDTNKMNVDYYKVINDRFGAGRYLVNGLPETLNNVNDTIKIKFRKPFKNTNEIPICKAFGPWYPVITAISCQKQ